MTPRPVHSSTTALPPQSETPALPLRAWALQEGPAPQMLVPLGVGGTCDSPLLRPGCRETGVELEGVVVTAEDEQVRGPSSEGQGFAVGSAGVSVWSRPPP